MAWLDVPVSGARVGRSFEVAGWAFKDGAGLSGVEVLLDGKPVAKAEYGLSSPGTAVYRKISTDPQHPDVGFHARVEAGDLAPGRHWLRLRLYGRGGSVEGWREPPVAVRSTHPPRSGSGPNKWHRRMGSATGEHHPFPSRPRAGCRCA